MEEINWIKKEKGQKVNEIKKSVPPDLVICNIKDGQLYIQDELLKILNGDLNERNKLE